MKKRFACLAALGVLFVPADAGRTQTGGRVQMEGDAARRKLLAEIEGKPAPPLVIAQWTRGKAVRLSDLKGKIVMLDFWGQWCGPCNAALPHNIELQKKYAAKGLVIIGIHTPYSAERLKEFVKAKGINYTVAVDASADGQHGKTIEKYHVDGFPDYYFVDRKGILRYADVANRAVDDALRELIAEK